MKRTGWILIFLFLLYSLAVAEVDCIATVKEDSSSTTTSVKKKKKNKIKRTKILKASDYAVYDRLPDGHTLFINNGYPYYFDTTKITGEIARSITILYNSVLYGDATLSGKYLLITSGFMFGGRMRIQVNYATSECKFVELRLGHKDLTPMMEFTMLKHRDVLCLDPNLSYDDASDGSYTGLPVYADPDTRIDTYIPNESDVMEISVDTQLSIIPFFGDFDTFAQNTECYFSRKKYVKSFDYKPGTPSFELRFKKKGKGYVVLTYFFPKAGGGWVTETHKYKFIIIDEHKETPYIGGP